jgi:predicted nuclease of predicted toxin-antitoxin system
MDTYINDMLTNILKTATSISVDVEGEPDTTYNVLLGTEIIEEEVLNGTTVNITDLIPDTEYTISLMSIKESTFVSKIILKKSGGKITFGEMMVMNGTENVAKQGVAAQSSVSTFADTVFENRWTADKGIDGVKWYRSTQNVMVMTGDSDNEWWSLTFKKPVKVTQIQLHSDYSSNKKYMVGTTLLVYNEKNEVILENLQKKKRVHTFNF